MSDPKNISEAAFAALSTADAKAKAEISRFYFSLWQRGKLDFTFTEIPPSRPARPEKPELLPPNQMPKRGKAGSLTNRITLLHALAHIELNAIDLAWDIVLRFGASMDRKFTQDWLEVADDEARHFLLLQNRLKELESYYGALPAHDGLWQAAIDTGHDLTARLAIVPMVLEARGLDVSPATIERLYRVGDEKSAECLDIIYNDEIGHVAKGVSWFMHYCQEKDIDAESEFKRCVKAYFKGILKPPFNESARNEAGFPASFYQL
ncbi:MAG: ferritin-like domain-containing protein [Sphingomonadales bacterium]